MKCEGPSYPAPYLRLCAGNRVQRKCQSHSCLLGLLTAIVVENDRQEEQHAQHVGKDGKMASSMSVVLLISWAPRDAVCILA